VKEALTDNQKKIKMAYKVIEAYKPFDRYEDKPLLPRPPKYKRPDDDSKVFLQKGDKVTLLPSGKVVIYDGQNLKDLKE
jgi:hypothetical protein